MSNIITVLDHDSGKPIGSVLVEITPISIKILSDHIYPLTDANSALCITAQENGKTSTGNLIYELGFYGPVTPEVLSFNEDSPLLLIKVE